MRFGTAEMALVRRVREEADDEVNGEAGRVVRAGVDVAMSTDSAYALDASGAAAVRHACAIKGRNEGNRIARDRKRSRLVFTSVRLF